MQRRIAIAAALAAPAMCATAARAQQQQVELRIVTQMPVGTAPMKVLDQLAIDLDAKTQHRVRLKLYPGGVQGDERDFVRKMGLGQLDGAELTSTGLALIEPSIGVLALPRLFASDAEADAVTQSAWPTYQVAFQKSGYVLTDPDHEGWVTYYSKGSIDSVRALQNAAVWRETSDIAMHELDAQLGVVDSPMQVGAVDDALVKGQLDVCYATPIETAMFQWSKKVRYETSMRLRRRIGALVIASSSLAPLSAADQQVVLAGFQAAAAKIARAMRRDDADAEKLMQRNGLAIVGTPSQMEAAFDAAAPKSWQNLVGIAYSQQDLDAVIKLRDAYRANGGAAAQQLPQPVVLRIATLAPPGSDWEKALTKLASDIDADTQHRVTVTLFPGADEKDFVQQMNQGTLDGAELTSAGLSLVDPSIRVLELPGMFASFSEYELAASVTWESLEKRYDQAGLVLAGREELGDVSFYSQQSLVSLPAFTRATIRLGPGDPVLQDLYTQLAITGVVVPPSQVDAAFASHLIDTSYATPTGMTSFRSRVRYQSTLALGYRTVTIVITKASMSGISSTDRAAVLRAVRRAAGDQRRAMLRANNAAEIAMLKRGIVQSAVSKELSAVFDAAAQKTWTDLVGTAYSQDLLDTVLKYRDKYREKHAKP